MADLHEAERVTRSKSLDIDQSTGRQSGYKWSRFSYVAAPPRSGRPAGMTLRPQGRQ